jgi:hypothetical protein
MVCALTVAAAPASAPAQARQAITIPATIDPTGARDITAALQRFIAAAPPGSTVVLRLGGRYRVDGTLQLRDRSGLTLDGNGATLFAATPGGPERAAIRLIGGRRWTLRNLTVVGAKPSDAGFDPSPQWQHGVGLRGVRGVRGATLRNVSVRDVWGDGIYIGLSTTGPTWSRDVSIIDSGSLSTGRMAVAVTAGRNVLGPRWRLVAAGPEHLRHRVPTARPAASATSPSSTRRSGRGPGIGLSMSPAADRSPTSRSATTSWSAGHCRCASTKRASGHETSPCRTTSPQCCSPARALRPWGSATRTASRSAATVSRCRRASGSSLTRVEGSTRVSISEPRVGGALKEETGGRPPAVAIGAVVAATGLAISLALARRPGDCTPPPERDKVRAEIEEQRRVPAPQRRAGGLALQVLERRCMLARQAAQRDPPVGREGAVVPRARRGSARPTRPAGRRGRSTSASASPGSGSMSTGLRFSCPACGRPCAGLGARRCCRARSSPPCRAWPGPGTSGLDDTRTPGARLPLICSGLRGVPLPRLLRRGHRAR